MTATGSRRLALNPEEAAYALGVSRDFFDEHILPNIRVVRVGRGERRHKVLVPITQLEKWLDRNAAIPLEAQR